MVLSIHHVCLVVRDRSIAEKFYCDALGLKRHHTVSSWLVLNSTSTLHLVEIPEAASMGEDLYREVQHFALQIDSLREVLRILLERGHVPFQMDMSGREREVHSSEDPLDFGLGTLFVRDPDSNLVEFIEEGHGIFQRSMRPNAATS